MRKPLLAMFFILFYLNNSAQDEIKLYLDANFNPVEKEKNAVVLRTARITNDHYIIEDQFINGRMINYGEFISIDPFIEDGLSKHYYEDGTLYSVGYYKNGNLTGKWIYFNVGNNDTVDYSPVENYLSEFNDSCIKSSQLTDNTLSLSVITNIQEDFQRFIRQKAYFPARARDTEDYQNCIFSFKLDTNGLISCPQISNCSSIDIFYELIRVAFLYKSEYKIEASINIADPLYDNSEPAFVFVEKQASFQGGSLENFRLWVQKNLEYPKEATEKNIYGRVTVQFVVNSRGYVTDVKILRSVESSLDNEACRVIMSSPKWAPANQGGRAVRQQFVMPVIFMMNENASESKGILIQNK